MVVRVSRLLTKSCRRNWKARSERNRATARPEFGLDRTCGRVSTAAGRRGRQKRGLGATAPVSGARSPPTNAPRSMCLYQGAPAGQRRTKDRCSFAPSGLTPDYASSRCTKQDARVQRFNSDVRKPKGRERRHSIAHYGIVPVGRPAGAPCSTCRMGAHDPAGISVTSTLIKFVYTSCLGTTAG